MKLYQTEIQKIKNSIARMGNRGKQSGKCQDYKEKADLGVHILRDDLKTRERGKWIQQLLDNAKLIRISGKSEDSASIMLFLSLWLYNVT